MILLTSFDRSVQRGDGTLAAEHVRCWLWFKTADEMTSFVESRRGGLPLPDGKRRKVKWRPYTEIRVE